MIDRVLNMVLRQVVNMFVRKGVNTAMSAGQAAWKARGARKTAKQADTIDVDAGRKPLGPDDRKGDNVLYPTDDYTEEMQPRK